MRLQKIGVTAASAAVLPITKVLSIRVAFCEYRVPQALKHKMEGIEIQEREAGEGGEAFVLVMMAPVGGGTAGLSCRIGGELSASFQQTAERLRSTTTPPWSVEKAINFFLCKSMLPLPRSIE